MGKTETGQDWSTRAYSFRIRIVKVMLEDCFGTDLVLSEEHPAYASQNLLLEGIVESLRAQKETQTGTPNLADVRLPIKVYIGDLRRDRDGMYYYGCAKFFESRVGIVTESCCLNISDEQFQRLSGKLPLYFLALDQSEFVWSLEITALPHEPFPEVKGDNLRMWNFSFRHLAFYLSNRKTDL